jgi:hypothetical protein
LIFSEGCIRFCCGHKINHYDDNNALIIRRKSDRKRCTLYDGGDITDMTIPEIVKNEGYGMDDLEPVFTVSNT